MMNKVRHTDSISYTFIWQDRFLIYLLQCLLEYLICHFQLLWISCLWTHEYMHVHAPSWTSQVLPLILHSVVALLRVLRVGYQIRIMLFMPESHCFATDQSCAFSDYSIILFGKEKKFCSDDLWLRCVNMCFGYLVSIWSSLQSEVFIFKF